MMESLKRLLARLMVYETNMRVLHWQVVGKGFDRTHSGITDPMTDQIHSDVDVVAEKLIMLGGTPLDYLSVIRTIKDGCSDVKFASADTSYSSEEVYKAIDGICSSICHSIEECLADSLIQQPNNVSIKARLEGMHEYYDLQMRFLNKRRLGD